MAKKKEVYQFDFTIYRIICNVVFMAFVIFVMTPSKRFAAYSHSFLDAFRSGEST